jgi:GH24 family phage-related lysozyme (muramidase)
LSYLIHVTKYKASLTPQVHEGYCEETYKDTKGLLTFGIGHLVQVGEPECEMACGTAVSAARLNAVFKKDVDVHVKEAIRDLLESTIQLLLILSICVINAVNGKIIIKKNLAIHIL